MFHVEHIVITEEAIQYWHDIQDQESKGQKEWLADGKNGAAARFGIPILGKAGFFLAALPARVLLVAGRQQQRFSKQSRGQECPRYTESEFP